MGGALPRPWTTPSYVLASIIASPRARCRDVLSARPAARRPDGRHLLHPRGSPPYNVILESISAFHTLREGRSENRDGDRRCYPRKDVCRDRDCSWARWTVQWCSICSSLAARCPYATLDRWWLIGVTRAAIAGSRQPENTALSARRAACRTLPRLPATTGSPTSSIAHAATRPWKMNSSAPCGMR